MVKTDRSFGAYFLLSILTGGIYGIWFLHRLAKDTNKICADDGKHTHGVAILVLLTICTLGIYPIFWWTNIADRTKQVGKRMNDYVPNEPSKVLLWLAAGLFLVFPALVGEYKVIENINEAAKAYNRLPDLPSSEA